MVVGYQQLIPRQDFVVLDHDELIVKGIEPVVWLKWSKWPPFATGLSMVLLKFVIAYLTAFASALSLATSGKYLHAIAVIAIASRAMHYQREFIENVTQFNRHVRKSVGSGLLIPELVVWFSLAPMMSGVYNAIISPCGFWFPETTMPTWKACMNIGLWLVAIKGIAEANEAFHIGDEQRQVVKPFLVRNHDGAFAKKLLVLKIWSWCNLGGETALVVFVMASHPFPVAALVVFVGLLPSCYANWLANKDMEEPDGWWCKQMSEYYYQLMALLTFPQSSVFGMPQISDASGGHNFGNKPARPFLIAHVAKWVFFLVALWCGSFFSAPLGFECSGGIGGNDTSGNGTNHSFTDSSSNSTNSTNPTVVWIASVLMDDGTCLFRLQFVVLGSTFLVTHLATVFILSCCHASWLEGYVNEEFMQECEDTVKLFKNRKKRLRQLSSAAP